VVLPRKLTVPPSFFPERQSSLAVEDAIAFWIGG
jgi:hypothetical protein